MHRSPTAAKVPPTPDLPRRSRARRPRPAACAGPLLAALALLGPTACDLRVEETECSARYSAQDDSLDVRLVHRGVCTEDDEAETLRRGVAAAQRILAGRREFFLLNWPWYVDLDDVREHAESALAEGEDADARRSLALLEHFDWQGSRAFLDAEGRLCGEQRFRIVDLHGFVELLLRATQESVLVDLGDADSDSIPFDAATRAALVAEAKDHVRWFGVDEDGVFLDLPIDHANAARLGKSLFHSLVDADEDDGEFLDVLLGFLLDVSTLDLRHGRLRATFALADGHAHEFRSPLVQYRPGLCDALRAAGIPLEAETSAQGAPVRPAEEPGKLRSTNSSIRRTVSW